MNSTSMNQINNQKEMLLSSMQKLINYLQVSKENQWEIFESLSKKDISKIINNLEDQDSKIRKLSLTLLGSLLHNNNALRSRLCQRMEISQIPGKICLNFCSQTNFQLHSIQIAHLVKLLKQEVKKEDQIFPIWVVSLRNEPLNIDFIPLSALNYIDPNDHLVGFTLIQENKENLKKTFLSLFGSQPQTPKKQIRKPLFKVTPMTQRISSHSTEFSNRFNRTSQNKTSLKQNMKRSLIVQGNQKTQNDSKLQNYKEIKNKMTYQSQNTSPQKNKRPQDYFNNSFDNQWNQSKSDIKGRDFQKVTPSVINNTNIYISGPVSEISLQDSKIQVKRLLQQKISSQSRNQFNRFQDNGYVKSLNQQSQRFIIQECFPSRENECNIFVRPFKKYERKTTKQDSTKNFKQFDYNKYRQFLKNLEYSNKQNKQSISNNKYRVNSSKFQDK